MVEPMSPTELERWARNELAVTVGSGDPSDGEQALARGILALLRTLEEGRCAVDEAPRAS